jgi:hypothetical protein
LLYNKKLMLLMSVHPFLANVQELKNEEIEEIVKSIEAEKEAEAERKRNRTAAVAQTAAGLGRDPSLVQTGGAGGVDSGAGSTESGHQ